jgi:hypothetical protein
MVTTDLFRGDSFPVSLDVTDFSTLTDLTGYEAKVSLRWPGRNTINLYSSDSGLTITATAATITGTFASTSSLCLPDAVRMYLVLTTTVPTQQSYFLGRVNVISHGSSTDPCDCDF